MRRVRRSPNLPLAHVRSEAQFPRTSYRMLVNRGDVLDFVTVIGGGSSRTVLEHAEDFEYDDYYDYEYQ